MQLFAPGARNVATIPQYIGPVHERMMRAVTDFLTAIVIFSKVLGKSWDALRLAGLRPET
jgi:hypothetical protein